MCAGAVEDDLRDHRERVHHPSQFVKNREDRLVVLNRVAASIIQTCRGEHPEFAFVYRHNVDRAESNGTKNVAAIGVLVEDALK